MATKTMTAEHKEALAKGREAARAVRAYLDALEANKPKRGRRRTPDSIRKRLDVIETTLGEANSLSRVQMIQERLDLTAELEALQAAPSVDMDALRKGFETHAMAYSQSKGITYTAWREVGVEPAVLKAAGISRSN